MLQKRQLKTPLSPEAFLIGGLIVISLLGEAYNHAPTPPPLSPRLLTEEGKLAHISLSPDEKWRLPPTKRTLARVAPLLLYKEDRRFYFHRGVDPIALVRAIGSTLKGSRQGGSTLTMQLARLWRPGPRNLWRKLLEIYWALGIELRHDKAEILSFYLTYAPFGRNIEGIEAAAQAYFGKEAERLTPMEMAALLLLSQRPWLLPALLRGEERVKRWALRWVERWYQAGLLTAAEYAQAQQTPLLLRYHSMPQIEPHAIPTPVKELDTLYLSLSLQREIHRLLRAELTALRPCGVSEGAILVAEAQTGRVRAYVPSSGYAQCAIDLIQAKRSVGSTLKPLLWAEGIFQGKIHSESPLLDFPKSYNGYVPINFERSAYQGIVSASAALRQSLNAPAVYLLAEIGINSFADRLRTLGITGVERSGHAGIVGAVEASLFQLVQAYTPLATRGYFTKLRRRASDPISIQSVWDSASTWIVSATLREGNGWSYKTGTSTKLRDAWCIAYDNRYIVGIWLGNPDGASSGCLKGRDAAFPLAHKVARLLGTSSFYLEAPTTVETLLTCPVTGLTKGTSCPRGVLALRRRGESSLPTCPHLRRLWVGPVYSFCEVCRPENKDTLKELSLPPLPWALVKIDNLPPHNPFCPAVQLDLLSPQEGAVLWLRRPRLPLYAASAPTAPVLWGSESDTIGWQMPSQTLWYVPSRRDTLLKLWAQVGSLRREVRCKVRWLSKNAKGSPLPSH
ncbi:MAG: transglycosylase domain-containing protein [Bacteroidia bacterium]|nr:transglycosylase domain-containing protein [Bacteroidia bacterium]